jgi:hypothetical protein
MTRDCLKKQHVCLNDLNDQVWVCLVSGHPKVYTYNQAYLYDIFGYEIMKISRSPCSIHHNS